MDTERSKSLAAALAAFSPEGPDFGERQHKAPDTEAFQRNLRHVSDSNRIYFTICVVLLVVLFAGACLLVLRSLDRPDQIAAIFGVTGLSFFGIFAKMVRLWKEKVNSDLLLVLAGNLRPQDLKGITDLVLRNYLK
jgi:hypothetical protein